MGGMRIPFLPLVTGLLFPLSVATPVQGLSAEPRPPQDAGVEAGPLTAAEASGFGRTSLLGEVQAFLSSLDAMPFAARVDVRELGVTAEGRSLPLVVVALDPPDRAQRSERLRVVCTGNIHSGEVEGKEALQALIREFARGEHTALLEGLELWLVPVFNADGNERVDPRNRETQNGPVSGVGTRGNAAGLDLNRDFVKAETEEVTALLRLWNELDPHVFIDLHTTNGSYHGYHLTYAPSLSTSADPDLDDFARATFLPEVAAAMLSQGLRIQHYGNMGRGVPRSWSTYDHRSRFGTNAFGLRGRLAILSEAYSYLPFEERVVVTRAFVLELLGSLTKHRETLIKACARADGRMLAREATFGSDTHLVEGHRAKIAVGGVREVPLGEGRGSRKEATDELSEEEMLVRVAFESRRRERLPVAWVVVEEQGAIGALLTRQGVEFEVLGQPRAAALSEFQIEEVQRSKRPFQGHHEVKMLGAWAEGPSTAPAGALWVPGAQLRGLVAAQLLEALSEDSAATWNYFDKSLGFGLDGSRTDAAPRYPVLRALTVR